MRSPIKLPSAPLSRSVLGIIGAGVVLGGAALWNRSQVKKAERDDPPKGQFIEIDGIKLHYVEKGSGSPIVFFHGNGATEEDFELSGIIAAAAEKFRVVVFDRPGFGYSERPRAALWTATAQAELLMKALDQLKIDRPVVVGHSWGCLVAAAAALNHPEKIRALLLLSGYYYPSFRTDVLLFTVPALPLIGDVMRWTISPLLGWALLGPIYRKLFSPAPVPAYFARDFPAGLALRPSQLRATSEDTGLMMPSARSLCDRYKDLRIPVTIIAGKEDEIATTEHQSARLHKDIAQSRYRSIGDAGHMIHHIVPDIILEELIQLAVDTERLDDAAQ